MQISIIVDRRDNVLSIILFLSILLHIVAFWLIFKLNNKLKQNKSPDPNEIAELLEYYLDEFKIENKQLKDELDNQSPLSKDEKNMNDVESDHSETEGNFEVEVEADDFLETSLEAEVLHLHQQKYPPAEIAKRLNCGKTEVELIIKFHDKKSNNT